MDSNNKKLSDLLENEIAVLSCLPREKADILNAHGLFIGRKVLIRNKYRFGKKITIDVFVQNMVTTISIEKKEAESIYVE